MLTISIDNPTWNCRVDVSGGRTLRNYFGGVVGSQVLLLCFFSISYFWFHYMKSGVVND